MFGNQQQQQMVVLSRDCVALLVPHGTEVTLPEGSLCNLMQSMGGCYTVVVNGNMFRIDGEDADALGFEPEVMTYETPEDGKPNEEDIWRTLKTIFDPEIPVNIVDLGLIYGCEVIHQSNGENHVQISMTLTAPGCGMGPVLVEEARRRVSKIPHVHDVEVDLVFDPPWDRAMMSETAQLELGLY